jgi:hypothetical protein
MKKERGCARNHGMRGGGTATFTSPAGIVQPGFYPEIKVVDSCSVARPGMIQMTPKGLMGGSRRRRGSARRRRTHRKMRGGDCGCGGAPAPIKLVGGTYKMDLAGQGMQPNQFAEVVKMPCGPPNNKLFGGYVSEEPTYSETQKGGAPFIEMPSVGYGVGGELVTADAGNVVPVMKHDVYNNTLGLSSACKQTGGKKAKKHSKKHGKNTKISRKSKKASRKSRKARKHTRKH